MFSVTFTVNKGKAHFPFGHDRTDVSNPDSNLITSMGDIAKETITVQSLHSTWTNPNKETIPWLCAGASWIQNWMDCISQPERLIKGIKSRKHEVTAQGCSPELNREHTHGSSIHLSYPPLHIAPFLWQGTQVTTAVLSPGMCITSTAGAPGKALNEGSSNSHLEAEPAPSAPEFAADCPNSSRLRSRRHPQRQGRDHEWLLTWSTVHVLGVLSKHNSSNLCSDFPKTVERLTRQNDTNIM